MKLNIDELASKVNDIISKDLESKSDLIKDGRQSNVLSARRIRDYMTKGLIHKPFGTKEKWFDESHVNALVALRKLQHNGLSEQYIISSSTHEYLEEKLSDQQNDAINFLNSISSSSVARSNGLIGSAYSAKSLQPQAATQSLAKDSALLNSLMQSSKPFTQYNEYCVDKDFGVYLKFDSKLNNSMQAVLVEKLQKEIKNLKENKND